MSFKGFQKSLVRVSRVLLKGDGGVCRMTKTDMRSGTSNVQGQVQLGRAHQGRRLHRCGAPLPRA